MNKTAEYFPQGSDEPVTVEILTYSRLPLRTKAAWGALVLTPDGRFIEVLTDELQNVR